jgi:DNA mismatch repair protein MutL
MPIRLLAPEVVARIAAGEVIERPASVVKELLENALDAGATRIDIDLEQGGSERIRVVDDGCGIPADELSLALTTHATSKLFSSDDLVDIATLGFRGEALASIAGVSKLTLQSRRHDAASGAEIASDGGVVSDVRPWGGPAGTCIDVRHLFYSVPVRKKFLKSAASELAAACEVLTRLALAHPHVHFSMRHNGRLVHDLPGVDDLCHRIGLFFGREVSSRLYDVRTEPLEYQIRGYVADPGCDRGNSKLQYFFVNGRWFRDRSLAFAFQDAYRGLLMTGRYPVGFLFLTVPPDKVDVNVHPSKAEVRFRESNTVFGLVRNAVKARLLRENMVATVSLPSVPVLPPEMASVPLPSTASLFEQKNIPTPAPVFMQYGPPLPSSALPTDVSRPPVNTPIIPATRVIPASEAPDVPALDFPDLPVGTAVQIHNSYIIQETPDGMLVIDQHALHERILYEQIRRRIQDGNLEVQRLLIPEPIDFPPEQAAFVIEHRDQLLMLGLDVSDFGGNTVLLASYPTLLKRTPPHVILSQVVDELVNTDRPPTREGLFNHLMATMACKAAVKAGDRLTSEEIQFLLHLRQMAEDSHHCPHGRPTTLLFSRNDLDRQFRRI